MTLTDAIQIGFIRALKAPTPNSLLTRWEQFRALTTEGKGKGNCYQFCREFGKRLRQMRGPKSVRKFAAELKVNVDTLLRCEEGFAPSMARLKCPDLANLWFDIRHEGHLIEMRPPSPTWRGSKQERSLRGKNHEQQGE